MQLASIILFVLAIAFYCCTSVLYGYQLKMRISTYVRATHLLAGCGLICHSALIGSISITEHGTQLQGGNILMLSSWAIMLIYCFFEAFSKARSYGAFLVPAALVTMIISWILGAGAPVDGGNDVYSQWPLLVIHVAMFFISAASFVIGGIASAMLLHQENLLKERRTDLMANQMPALSSLKRVTRRSILIGLPVFTVGLLLGSMRAAGLGVVLWYLSPRIVLSIVLWIVYAIALCEIFIFKASSRAIAWTTICAACGIIVLAVLSSILPMLV